MAERLVTGAYLPHLYQGDESDGWSRGMAAVTFALLARASLLAGPVLEVGCGGGQILAQLQTRFPGHDVMGVDLHPLALRYAQERAVDVGLVQAALPTLPWTADTFALVLALDVLDQQGVDLAAALVESRRVLRPGGLLLMRVSAYPWLYGPHDVAFGTGRRLAREELGSALQQAGFVVERMTHANAGLAGPVIVQRLAQRWGVLPWQPGLYASQGLHRVAAALLGCEAAWLRRCDLRLGLSLFALARKPVI